MLSILVIIAAAAVFFGVNVEKAKKAYAWIQERVDTKTILASGLIVLAVLLLPDFSRDDAPPPVPDTGPLSLESAFVGPTASADASTIGEMLLAIADDLEYDGNLAEPDYRTGLQIDQVRKKARLLRCKGESIGDRQPAARDKIAAYLEAHAGTDSGALTAESRASWISAFRDVGRAASEAAH